MKLNCLQKFQLFKKATIQKNSNIQNDIILQFYLRNIFYLHLKQL